MLIRYKRIIHCQEWNMTYADEYNILPFKMY